MQHWWVADLWQQNPVLLVSWVVWVIGSIVLHELAHGWAAILAGDRTPIETGHMTWNPLVHMGQASLVMFAVVGIAWGQMPVDRSRFRGRFDDAFVALAGPMMNLLLFCLSLVATAAVVVYKRALGDPLAPNLFMFCISGAFLNLALLVFNLLPVPPLDGSRVVAGFVPAYARLLSSPNAPALTTVAFIAVFLFGGKWAFGVANQVTTDALQAILRAIGHPVR